MAKKSKRKIPLKSKRRSGRQERRFVSQTATNPMVIRLVGALAALVLGAGVWAYAYGKSFAADDAMKQLPSYFIAGGAVLLGIAIWVGSSSEATIRVGDPGIAMEKGELRRMAWWAIERITFESGALALVVTGKDEANVEWTLKLPLKSHPEAGGWLIKEALERIPRRVDISEETLEKLPGAGDHAGEKVDLEPLQVVGKRCAATGKTVSYEPDATVCARCERVYLKRALPKKCKCGNPLGNLKTSEDEDGSSEESDSSDDERASSDDIEATEKAET